MADEAKVVETTEPQPPSEQGEPAVQAVDAANVKALQRELQRARNQLGQNSALTGRIDALQQAVDGLVHALSNQEGLNDSGKATLGAVQQLRASQANVDASRAAVTKQIHDVVQAMGVTSWDDPRVADVLEAYEEGDLVEALSVAKQVRRAERTKVPEEKVAKTTDDVRIKAEVARQLKEMGVLEVDKTKSAGGTSLAPTLTDLLAKNIHGLTPAEAVAHAKALIAARRG